MVTCELCGRQFKNTQGLRGHKTFFHGNGASSRVLADQAATEKLLSKLEKRLEQVEYATGLKKVNTLDKSLYNEKPLTEKLDEVTQQLATLSSYSANGEFRKITEQFSQLSTRVNKTEDRITRLEESQKKAEEDTMKSIKANKEAYYIQMLKIIEAINNVVDKFGASLNYLQREFGEQRLITDWVKKEYNLRKVQKVNRGS